MGLWAGAYLFLFLQSSYGQPDTTAPFRRALQAAQENQMPRAEELFADLVQKFPENQLYRFNYANALFAQKKFSLAATEYSQVANSPSPLGLPALIYLAKCQRLLGLEAEASSTLRLVAQDGLSPALRKEWEKELQLQPNIFDPAVRFSLGYDSNFYGDPNDALYSPRGEGIFEATATLAHTLRKRPRSQWQNRYTLAAEGPFSPAEERTFSLGVESEWIWASEKKLFAFAPGFTQYFRNTSLYYMEPAALLRYRQYGDSGHFGLNYGFYRPLKNSSAYSFLAGQNHEASAALGTMAGNWNLNFSGHLEWVRTGDYQEGTTVIPLRNIGYGPSIQAAISRPSIDFAIGLSYRRRNYERNAQPGNEKRKDHYYSVNLSSALPIRDRLSAVLQLDLIKNTSTLGPSSTTNKNYQQMVAMAGLLWSE